MLSKRIKERRIYLGLTQDDLAAMTDSKQNQIWAWENGKNPSVDKLEKLADALETTTDYLLGRTDLITPAYTGLSEFETELINVVRAKNPDDQKRLMKVVAAL